MAANENIIIKRADKGGAVVVWGQRSIHHRDQETAG